MSEDAVLHQRLANSLAKAIEARLPEGSGLALMIVSPDGQVSVATNISPEGLAGLLNEWRAQVEHQLAPESGFAKPS